MEWSEIKDAIRADLLARGLKEPRIRLSALNCLEQLLRELFPEFPKHPTMLLGVGKEASSKKLARLKETGTLNGAERSVLNQIFAQLPEVSPYPSANKQLGALRAPAVANQRHRAVNACRSGKTYKRGLRPVIWESSRVLVLGTLPGDESLRLKQYYANPNNQFWKILSEIYGESIEADYLKRLEFLRRRGVALWDVLRSAERPGSADSATKNAVANDFTNLVATPTGLKAIVFNGGEAKKLFRRHVEKSQPTVASSSLLKVDLPSTSPAPGKHVLPLEEKVARWKLLTNL